MSVKLKPGVSWSHIEQGLMLVHPVNDTCLILNKSGETVWSYLQNYSTSDTIIDEICSTYGESQRSIIAEDVQSMLELLLEYDLIEGDIE